MNYKISGGMKKNKKTIIIGLVLWVILTIVLILPFTYSVEVASSEGTFNLSVFFENIVNSMGTPIENMQYLIQNRHNK